MKQQKKKKHRVSVLMVGPVPPQGSYIGGIGVMLNWIINNWFSKSVEMTFFNSENRVRDFSTTGRFGISNIKYFSHFLFRFLKAVHKNSPEVLHYNSSWGGALLKDLLLVFVCKMIYSKKIVFHIHYADTSAILLPRTKILKTLEICFMYLICDRVLLMANNVGNSFLNDAPKISKRIQQRSLILHNFTTVPDISMRHEHAGIKILFIGSIGKRKGAFDIIDACSCLLDLIKSNQIKLVFAGPFDSAEVEEEFRNFVEKKNLGDFCLFTGSVLGNAKHEIFLSSDIFILPSYAEGIPIAMLEAMSYGLPVIVSNVGGIPEVVKSRVHGLMVAPGNIAEIANAISQIVNDKHQRNSLGKNGRKLVEQKHSLKRYLEKLEALYADI